MSRRVLVLVLGWALVMSSACSSSNEPDGPPVLERIDGPAQVDPSYDPFATTPLTVVDGEG